MDKIKTLPQQSLIDVSVQHLGCVEGIMLVARDNGLSVTDDLAPGTELTVSDPMDDTVAKTYGNMLHSPATSLSASDSSLDSQIRVFDDTFTQQFE